MGEVPANFLGKWKVDKSENFDQYLEAKGVNWLMRKAASKAPAGKELKHNGDGSYTIINSLPKGTFTWTFTLGVPIETKGPDDKMHRITFHLEGGKVLVEEHVRFEESSEVEKATYQVDGENLVLELSAGTVSCKRIFKKTA